MNNGREQIYCYECGDPLGWINYSGPMGMTYRDYCHTNDTNNELDCDEEKEEVQGE